MYKKKLYVKHTPCGNEFTYYKCYCLSTHQWCSLGADLEVEPVEIDCRIRVIR